MGDKREEEMIECLEQVANGKIGVIKKHEGQFIYITEIYPYKDGMYILYTKNDTRCLSYKYRKLLFFVNERGLISILAQCDIKGEQSIDTTITKEFIDANCAYEILKDSATNSIFFKKKNTKKMEEKIKYCSELAKNAIRILNEKHEYDEIK